jgi:transglutaminase-like putative cysteine protease
MFRGVSSRFKVVACAAILATATAPVFGQEVQEFEPFELETAARRLADEILEASASKQRLPLTSDAEHARSIDPVLTRGTPMWIHEALPFPPLTVTGGRVFSYRDSVYDPLDAPVLKVRAIDDNQIVPFMVRVVINPQLQTSPDNAINVSFPTPSVFGARIGKLATWVGSNRADASIAHSQKDATLDIRIPIAKFHVEESKPITVLIDGELKIGSYSELPPGRFANFDGYLLDPELQDLAKLELNRDISVIDDRERLQDIAENVAAKATSDYESVVAVNSWVSSHLRYQESPATRSPVEALEDRSGDCDDYSALAVALLRTIRIPARQTTGLLYDFDTIAAHTWVEVALPTQDGGLHWFIVDPTLAGAARVESRKTAYVQFKDRVMFYTLRPVVTVEGMTGRPTTDILLNWRQETESSFTDAGELSRFTDLVIQEIDQRLSRGAERLAEKGLLIRRESASIAGSPYWVVDRPVVEKSSSRIQLRLENEERLVLDLVAENTSVLEAKTDLETINQMRAAYTDLSSLFFVGMEAYSNLELVFYRDRHSDRLHTVSLRFGRYLVEHYLERILKRLTKDGLLTEDETARIAAIAEASGGKNLYLLQELARQLPPSDSF